MSLLEYAPQPAVGDVTVSRSGDTTIVTRNGSFRRLVRDCIWIPVVPAVAISLFGLGVYQDVSATIAVTIAVGFIVVVSIIMCAKPAFIALQPVRWTITRESIVVRLRLPSRFIEEAYPRSEIADVRVERVKLPNWIVKRLALVTVKPTGTRVAHYFGPRAELLFMADGFRMGLGLGEDPLHESEYAALPPGSLLVRRVGVGYTVLERQPPWLGSIGWLILMAVAPAVGFYSLAPFQIYNNRLLGLARFTVPILSSALVTWGLLAAVRFVRRRVIIEINPTGLALAEQSLFRPARESWPISKIKGFVLKDGVWVDLNGAPPAPLLTFGSAADVQAVYDSLVVGLTRARRMLQPVPAETPPSGST